MAKNSIIETAIVNVATHKLAGKYNLSQYKEGAKRHQEKLNAILHKSICEQILAFKEAHKDIPMYFILSVGIAKGAYKKSEFDKGYKHFDTEKVEKVAEFGKAYNAYNGVKSVKLSDVTIRLMMRYYELVSKDMETFTTDLNKSNVLGKEAISRGNYIALCKNLNIPIKDKVEEEVNEKAEDKTANNAPQEPKTEEVESNTTNSNIEPHKAA